MASGILGQSAPSATTLTTLYTVPANNYAVLNVSVTNRGTTATTVRLALSAAASPTSAEYIEFDSSVPGNGVLERTGIAMQAGKLLVVYAGNANLSFSAYGIEQSTL